jgi:hypothetical protein
MYRNSYGEHRMECIQTSARRGKGDGERGEEEETKTQPDQVQRVNLLYGREKTRWVGMAIERQAAEESSWPGERRRDKEQSEGNDHKHDWELIWPHGPRAS